MNNKSNSQKQNFRNYFWDNHPPDQKFEQDKLHFMQHEKYLMWSSCGRVREKYLLKISQERLLQLRQKHTYRQEDAGWLHSADVL